MSRPEISVIIPYYNAVRHIERAARSLFGQSLGRRLETVWVDDGSTDGSAALLHSILSEEGADAPLYTTLTHDHNRGSAAARLTGLSAASGRYIIFCDADDYVDNDAYETMLHTACTTGADMVVCDYIVERGDSRVRHTGMRDSRSLTSDMLRGKVHARPVEQAHRTPSLRQHRMLWIEGIDMWEDAWVTTRAAYHAQKTAYLPRPLYHYVSNPQSYTPSRFSDKSISDMLAVTEMLDEHFAATPCRDMTAALKRRARALALYYGSEERRRKACALWPDIPYWWLDITDGLPPHQRAMAFCAAHRSLALKPSRRSNSSDDSPEADEHHTTAIQHSTLPVAHSQQCSQQRRSHDILPRHARSRIFLAQSVSDTPRRRHSRTELHGRQPAADPQSRRTRHRGSHRILTLQAACRRRRNTNFRHHVTPGYGYTGRIALAVGCGAIVLMGFFPVIFSDITLPLWYAYASFGVMLWSALLSYFVNYRQVLLTADQKDYRICLSYRSAMIAKTITQMWVVSRLTDGYIWWLILEGVFAAVGAWVVDLAVRRTFPTSSHPPKVSAHCGDGFRRSNRKSNRCFPQNSRIRTRARHTACHLRLRIACRGDSLYQLLHNHPWRRADDGRALRPSDAGHRQPCHRRQ